MYLYQMKDGSIQYLNKKWPQGLYDAIKRAASELTQKVKSSHMCDLILSDWVTVKEKPLSNGNIYLIMRVVPDLSDYKKIGVMFNLVIGSYEELGLVKLFDRVDGIKVPGVYGPMVAHIDANDLSENIKDWEIDADSDSMLEVCYSPSNDLEYPSHFHVSVMMYSKSAEPTNLFGLPGEGSR